MDMEKPRETESGADTAPPYTEYLNRRLAASDHQLDNICLQVNVAIENKKGEFVDAKKWQEMYNRPPIAKHRLFKYTINSSQKQFTAFRLHCQIPNFSALIFQNGSMMIVGVKDEGLIIDSVKMTALQLADAINKNVMLTKVQTVNIVASFSLPPLNFTNLQFFLNNNSVPFIHNPHTFPGLFIKVMIPKHTIPEGQSIFDFYHAHHQVKNYRMITVLVFQGGKAVILGTQGKQDWHVAHEMITALFEKISAQSFNANKLERNRIDYSNKIKIRIFKEGGVPYDSASQQVVKQELFYDEDEDFHVLINSETYHQPKTPCLTWFTKVPFLLGGKRGKEHQHYFDREVNDEDEDYNNNLYRDLGHDLKDSRHQLNKTIACINSSVSNSRLFDDKTLDNQLPCSLQNEKERVIYPKWWCDMKTKISNMPDLIRVVTFGVKEKPITRLKDAPFNSFPTTAEYYYCSCLTTDGGLTVTYTLCKPLSCLQKLAKLNPPRSSFEENARNIQYHNSQRFVDDLNSADNVWSLRLISSCPQCCWTLSSKRPVVIPTPDGLGVWPQSLDLVFLSMSSKSKQAKNHPVGNIPYVSHFTPLCPDTSHFKIAYPSSSSSSSPSASSSSSSSSSPTHYAEIQFLELNNPITQFSPLLKHVEQDVVVANRPSKISSSSRSPSSSGIKYLHGNRFSRGAQKKNNEEETSAKKLRLTYDLLEGMIMNKHQATRATNVNMIAEFLKTSACVVAKNSGCKFKASQHANNINNDDDAAPFSSEFDEDFGSGNMFKNFVNEDSTTASKIEEGGGGGGEEKQQQDREIHRDYSKRISPAHIHFQNRRKQLNKMNRQTIKHGTKAKQNKQLQSQMENTAATATITNPDSNNFSELYGLITILNEATMGDTGVTDFGSYSIDINRIKNFQEFLEDEKYMLNTPLQNYRQKYRVARSVRNNCQNLLDDHAENQQYKVHLQNDAGGEADDEKDDNGDVWWPANKSLLKKKKKGELTSSHSLKRKKRKNSCSFSPPPPPPSPYPPPPPRPPAAAATKVAKNPAVAATTVIIANDDPTESVDISKISGETKGNFT